MKMPKKRFSHEMNLINEYVGRQGQRGDNTSVSLSGAARATAAIPSLNAEEVGANVRQTTGLRRRLFLIVRSRLFAGLNNLVVERV
jgi:hypothetical protein